MLLARRQPVAGFRKRLPVAAAETPKARGFGPRRKIVAAPRRGLRIASSTGEGFVASSPSEDVAPADWIGNIDWVGDAGRPIAASGANGHDVIADLPLPEAIPSPSPEIRTLN